MTIGIYSISDSETGEVLYVGQSSNIEERWKHHLKRLRGSRHLDSFSKWFKNREGNESCVEFHILEECENIDSIKNQLEIKWFNILKPKFYGAVPSENRTWTHSRETRMKISDSSRKVFRVYIMKCKNCGKYFSKNRERTFCSTNCARLDLNQKQRIVVDKDTLNDLYWKQEMSRAEIGRKLGIGQTTVLKYMKKYDIPRRDTVTALKLTYTK